MRVRAPGKVVVLGEYAVLDGAPALVAAVDAGVEATWSAGPMRIETPGDDRFVRAALEAVSPPRGCYRFSSYNDQATQTKPGLGGSAAAVVAALGLVAALRGAIDRPRLFERALEVHRAVQGSGSGVDIAASVHGGWLRYQVDGGHVTPLSGPDFVVVWSGASARTGPRVERYLAWSSRRPFVQQSAAWVEAFADAPSTVLHEAGLGLGVMAEQAGFVYWTPALRHICALAIEHGGGAKPSGAGGGDSAVAVFREPRQARAFEQACQAAGLVVLPLALAPGVGPLPEEPVSPIP